MKEKEIRHHNSISQGKLEYFELRELKLFLALMSDVKKETLTYDYNSINIKQFINMGDQSYTAFEKIISNLQKRRILIFESEDKYKAYSIFSLLEFNKKEKCITVEYNHKFFPLIGEFQDNFCKYKLKYIEPLKSKYSVIFYMLSKANLFKKKYYLSVDEIREKIGRKIRIDNLDIRVFEPMIEEINKFTDINLTIEKEYTNTRGKGRKSLVGYTFIVSKKIFTISDELKKAMVKAKKNIYINKSKTLNNQTIQILLDDIQETNLINGLNFAYKKINKDFTKLEYLKRVIISAENKEDEEIELIEPEHKNDIFSKNEIIKAIDNNLKITKQMEEEVIKYLIKNNNMTEQFLKNTKIKSKGVYDNIIKGNLQKIKNDLSRK